MNPDIFFIFDRDRELEPLYAAVGRALAFASRFENNCRVLSKVLALKENPAIRFGPVEERTAFLKQFNKLQLFKHIAALAPRFVEIPDHDIEALLNSARDARNIVAHELTCGFDEDVKERPRLESFLNELADLVQRIAIGDRIICVAMSQITHEPVVACPALEHYHLAAADWVTIL